MPITALPGQVVTHLDIWSHNSACGRPCRTQHCQVATWVGLRKDVAQHLRERKSIAKEACWLHIPGGGQLHGQKDLENDGRYEGGMCASEPDYAHALATTTLSDPQPRPTVLIIYTHGNAKLRGLLQYRGCIRELRTCAEGGGCRLCAPRCEPLPRRSRLLAQSAWRVATGDAACGPTSSRWGWSRTSRTGCRTSPWCPQLDVEPRAERARAWSTRCEGDYDEDANCVFMRIWMRPAGAPCAECWKRRSNSFEFALYRCVAAATALLTQRCNSAAVRVPSTLPVTDRCRNAIPWRSWMSSAGDAEDGK